MPTPGTIPLTQLPRMLRDHYGAAVTYGRLHRETVNGILPIKQSDTGRYFANEVDVPRIAELLGIPVATKTAA